MLEITPDGLAKVVSAALAGGLTVGRAEQVAADVHAYERAVFQHILANAPADRIDGDTVPDWLGVIATALIEARPLLAEDRAQRDAAVRAEVGERIASAIEACCKARVENNDQRLNFSKGATAAYTHAARIARTTGGDR